MHNAGRIQTFFLSGGEVGEFNNFSIPISPLYMLKSTILKDLSWEISPGRRTTESSTEQVHTGFPDHIHLNTIYTGSWFKNYSSNDVLNNYASDKSSVLLKGTNNNKFCTVGSKVLFSVGNPVH